MAGLVSRLLMPLLALTASFLMYYFSWLANYSPLVVSPQGCDMSWMSPHYILHTDFNKSWTPLATRYTLWLYRERGIDDINHHVSFNLPFLSVFQRIDKYGNQNKGLPVLFIPGNAGSSRQVRSIASSAARQFVQEPPILAGTSQISKPLDFFTGTYITFRLYLHFQNEL
jgi:glycosylphosphatidylinositol deacylase